MQNKEATDRNGNILRHGDTVQLINKIDCTPTDTFGVVRDINLNDTLLVEHVNMNEKKDPQPTGTYSKVNCTETVSLFWQEHLQEIDDIMTGRAARQAVNELLDDMSPLERAYLTCQIKAANSLREKLQAILHQKEHRHLLTPNPVEEVKPTPTPTTENRVPSDNAWLKMEQVILLKDKCMRTHVARVVFTTSDTITICLYSKQLILSIHEEALDCDRKDNVVYQFEVGEFEELVATKMFTHSIQVIMHLINTGLYQPKIYNR